MSMKNYWMGVWGQVRALRKRFLRDKTSLFFTFLFPLIFLLVFGTVFGGNDDVNLDVAIVNYSETDFAKEFEKGLREAKNSSFGVVEAKEMSVAREKMKRGEIVGIVELSKEFGEVKDLPGFGLRPQGEIKVLFAKGSERAGNLAVAVMKQVADEINKKMGQPEPPLKVESEAVGEASMHNFDYVFTGLLAFSLMSMGVFGLANAMPTEKQKGAYRRLRAAPFTAGQLIIANAIHYLTTALVSAVMMLIVGVLVYKLNISWNWLIFLPFILLSAIMMVGFGLLVGSWAKNENQSAPLSNLVSFPMMFLSGVFFPSFMFPDWLKTISQFVPMTPVVEGFRMIMSERVGFMTVLPQFGLVAMWTVIIYVAAIKLFRWE